MNVTLEQYFHDPRTGIDKPHTLEQRALADELLDRVNALLQAYDQWRLSQGLAPAPICPHTGCYISGSPGGAGDGGFRLPSSSTGASTSSHKEARAVDVWDPSGDLDAWANDERLTQYALYREHPDATKGWCHLTTRAPGSGRRTFQP